MCFAISLFRYFESVMKLALVHDYLSQDGGAERVLQSFHDIWPEAPIFVLFHDKKKLPAFRELDVRESFLAKLPFGKIKYQWYTALMPLATERHNLHEFDVVVSSTSAFAKGVLTRPDTLHISYCHTPTRYLWTDTHEYLDELRYGSIVKSFLPRFIHHWRLWDKMSVDRVDRFLANSRTVQQRIQKYYRRESDILFPPVNTTCFSPVTRKEELGNYYLAGGRVVPYKRFDLLIQVFNRLGWPLKIFGDGPALSTLKRFAKPNIEFVGRVSEEEKADLMRRALAFLNPQVEDFGLTVVESMASGRPVIAYGVGGATETVIPGLTGQLFYRQQWEDLLDLLLHFDPYKWDSARIRTWAESFDEKHFKHRMRSYVESVYEEHKQGLNQCQLPLNQYVSRNKKT